MKVIICKDEATYLKEASRLILDSITTAVKERSSASIALSGGNTPKKIYLQLAESYFRGRIPWRDLNIFWGDERCVPPDHPDSNYRMAKETFLSKVSIPSNHIFRIPAEMENPREAAKSYENTLRAFFKVRESMPKFDLILLGLGEDGHTASLFPGTTAEKEKQHWVVANFVEKLSAKRISLTFPIINNARRVLFHCSGASKAKIVREVFRDDISMDRYPAQRVRPNGGELIWLLDQGASSKLPSTVTAEAIHV